MNMAANKQFADTNSTGRLLEHIGLLCRVAPEIRQASSMLLSYGRGRGTIDRTCIDGGQNTLVTLRIGNASAVGFASANNWYPANNVRHWHRWSIQNPAQTGESLIFGIPQKTDWPLTVEHLGNIPANLRTLGELRMRGNVYMATRHEPETGSSWLSFGLHKNQSPRATLAAMGHPLVWIKFSKYMAELLGHPITERARPWSIAIPISQNNADRHLVRVGSTNWARLSEGAVKSSNFARQVADLGGDRSLAESVYGLVLRQTSTPRAIGVAAEFDFKEGNLIAAQYTLRVPQID